MSASAFSAMASENGEAAREIYASMACTMASMPQAAAMPMGAVVRKSGSRMAAFGMSFASKTVSL